MDKHPEVQLNAIWGIRTIVKSSTIHDVGGKAGECGVVENLIRFCEGKCETLISQEWASTIFSCPCASAMHGPANSSSWSSEHLHIFCEIAAATDGKENTSTVAKDDGKEAEILEAALGTLLELAIDHEENSRRVLSAGVATLIDIAEQGVGEKEAGGDRHKESSESQEIEKKVAVAWEETKERKITLPPKERRNIRQAVTQSNASLAVDLLQAIGPHSWTLCGNCGSRESGGERCSQCGHKISFSV